MSSRGTPRARLVAAGVALAIAGLSLSACKEVETETATGYEPATLKEVNEDLKQVTLTEEGAARTGLKTAKVRQRGGDEVLPYAALIYDAEGHTYVYTSPKPLTYLRKEVEVDRIDGNRVLVSDGPAAGTEVVTVGAAQVYGTELEIAASH
jgi:multidrug efflux pump subunit AcrA (membrane-fusion protein)